MARPVASPWALPPEMGEEEFSFENLMSLGQQAIQSGEITPEEALQAVGDVSGAPQSSSVASLFGLGGLTPKRSVTTQKSVPIMRSPEDLEELYNAASSIPAIQNQQQMLDQLRQMQGAKSGAEAGPQTDLSPLVALLKSEFSKDISGGYTKPRTIEDVSAEDQKALLTRFGGQQSMLDSIQKMIDQRKLGTEVTSSNVTENVGGAGIKQIPASQSNLIAEGISAYNLMDQLDPVLESNKDIMGPIKGRESKLASYLEYGQGGQRASAFNAEMKKAAQVIGKYLEGGVLRKEDESKYREMLPSLSDSLPVARSKLKSVQSTLADKQKNLINTYKNLGYNPGNQPELKQNPVSPLLSGDSKVPTPTPTGGGLTEEERAELSRLKQELGQ